MRDVEPTAVESEIRLTVTLDEKMSLLRVVHEGHSSQHPDGLLVAMGRHLLTAGLRHGSPVYDQRLDSNDPSGRGPVALHRCTRFAADQ